MRFNRAAAGCLAASIIFVFTGPTPARAGAFDADLACMADLQKIATEKLSIPGGDMNGIVRPTYIDPDKHDYYMLLGGRVYGFFQGYDQPFGNYYDGTVVRILGPDGRDVCLSLERDSVVKNVDGLKCLYVQPSQLAPLRARTSFIGRLLDKAGSDYDYARHRWQTGVDYSSRLQEFIVRLGGARSGATIALPAPNGQTLLANRELEPDAEYFGRLDRFLTRADECAAKASLKFTGIYLSMAFRLREELKSVGQAR